MIREFIRTALFAGGVGVCLTLGSGGGAQAQAMTLDICPTDYGSFPEDAPALTCGCSAEAVKEGSVWGTNPYYYQSSLCRAARHAGALSAEGGQISVTIAKQPFFPGVTRNGIDAASWGGGGGFRVARANGDKAGVASFDAAASGGMQLDICPRDYNNFPEDASTLTCGCDAAAVKEGSVWGTNPYYYQSSLCRAARHAGAVGADGGQIKVQPENATIFPGVTRNDVEAASWSKGVGFRIMVEAGSTPVAGQGAETANAAQAAGMVLDICPNDYNSFPEDAPTLTCGCSAEATKEGSVWGTNPYYYQSSLCRAARHAGVLSGAGGQISVTFAKQPFFPGVTRNGIEAAAWSAGAGFRVGRAGGDTTGLASFDATASGGLELDICPRDYNSFPEDAPALTCGCDAAAMKEGSVWGANPYYYQSSLCRAALHAGATGKNGGKIVVQPEAATVFPGVTRNGIEASSWSKGAGFRVSAAPGSMPVVEPQQPAVDAEGKPIQAPIAETLAATGRVQLYINFATDKDKPLPTSEPVLQELLATLQGNSALRIELIGHTDSQGSAPYNLDLSQRRAASVYLWLIQHGIDSARLRSDGRGLMEPIADNETDSGRALNRRVEARALN